MGEPETADRVNMGEGVRIDHPHASPFAEHGSVGVRGDKIVQPVSPPFYPGQGGGDVPSVNRPAAGQKPS